MPPVWLLAFIVILTASLLAATPARGSGQAVAESSEEPKPQAKVPSEQVIGLPDIASRATEVVDLIRSSKAKLGAGAELQTIRESLPATSRLVALERLSTSELLQQKPTLDSLERQQLIWQQRQIVANNWLTALTERASLLQGILDRLAGLTKTWTATRVAVQTANVPGTHLRADRRDAGRHRHS